MDYIRNGSPKFFKNFLSIISPTIYQQYEQYFKTYLLVIILTPKSIDLWLLSAILGYFLQGWLVTHYFVSISQSHQIFTISAEFIRSQLIFTISANFCFSLRRGSDDKYRYQFKYIQIKQHHYTLPNTFLVSVGQVTIFGDICGYVNTQENVLHSVPPKPNILAFPVNTFLLLLHLFLDIL